MFPWWISIIKSNSNIRLILHKNWSFQNKVKPWSTLCSPSGTWMRPWPPACPGGPTVTSFPARRKEAGARGSRSTWEATAALTSRSAAETRTLLWLSMQSPSCDHVLRDFEETDYCRLIKVKAVSFLTSIQQLWPEQWRHLCFNELLPFDLTEVLHKWTISLKLAVLHFKTKPSCPRTKSCSCMCIMQVFHIIR